MISTKYDYTIIVFSYNKSFDDIVALEDTFTMLESFTLVECSECVIAYIFTTSGTFWFQ